MGVFWHHTFWSAWAGSGSGRPSFMAILRKTMHAFYRAVVASKICTYLKENLKYKNIGECANSLK